MAPILIAAIAILILQAPITTKAFIFKKTFFIKKTFIFKKTTTAPSRR